MRNGGRRGEQFIWRRGRYDRRTFIAKDGAGRKKGARDGDFVDIARFLTVFYLIRLAGILRLVRFDTDGDRSNGRRFFGRAAFGKIACENGEFGIRGAASRGGGIFTVMSFYLYLMLGFIGGIPAGMGMGGGTVTIPLLVLVGGVEQKIAQCANLFSFLPMSVGALKTHAENGLLETQGIWWIVLPALALSALGTWAAAVLPSQILRKGFGIFLIGLALVGFSRVLKKG